MMLKGCQDLHGGGGRRLRHLLPRPSTSITKNFAPCCPVSTGYCSCAHSNKFFPMNHQQTSAADHGHSRKEEKYMEHIVSTRWNPTPEQLMALEEMYRRGVRTPSSEEIKLIAAKLRQFGKIEGKNVFYWFQNHKARERQKRRRQPEPSASSKLGNDQETLEENDKGFGRTDLETQDNNELMITGSKETNASKQGPMVTEEGEMLQHLKSQRKMAKDSSVNLLSSKASDTFINATNSSEHQQKMMFSTLNFSLFSASSAHNAMINKEDQTLELFPLQKDGANEMDFKEYSMNLSSNVPRNQFYQFL